jgi:hypothetical protein
MRTMLPIILFVGAMALFAWHNATRFGCDPHGWKWHLIQWMFTWRVGAALFCAGFWWREFIHRADGGDVILP